MPAALPTLHDLDTQLTFARAELIVAEDTGDRDMAEFVRLRIDTLLEHRHIVQQRQAAD